MTKDKSLIQSCVDHINTAIDVDPWAKELVIEMGKEILKAQLSKEDTTSDATSDTTSDCVSRQAVIDALEKVAELFPWRVPGKSDTYDSYNEAWNDAIGRAEMEIEKLPSVQPVDKDINVSCKDAISRQAAIDDLHGRDPSQVWDTADVEVWINALPSVQPDIIACGDCKHWICHDRRCGYWNHGVQPLMWCSQAERRTDGSN